MLLQQKTKVLFLILFKSLTFNPLNKRLSLGTGSVRSRIRTEINVLTSNLTTLACQLLCESHHYPKISYMSHNDNNSGLSALTLSWQGYKNDDFGRGGAFNGPPLKSV